MCPPPPAPSLSSSLSMITRESNGYAHERKIKVHIILEVFHMVIKTQF